MNSPLHQQVIESTAFTPWLSLRQRLQLLALEARMDALSLFRTPGFVIPSLIFPVMFYLLFGVLFGQGGQNVYLLASYGCFGVMGPALFKFRRQCRQRENSRMARDEANSAGTSQCLYFR